jgi:lia operon protein LiaG
MKDTFHFGFVIMSLDLVIQVPEKEYESMILTSSSGDIRIKDVKAVEMETEISSGDIIVEGVTVASAYKLETSSGDIRVKDTKADTFDLHASSGDIILENLEGNINVETSSGDIEIENKAVNGNILAEASSGDVSITNQETPKSLSIDFKGSSGDGTVNLEGVSYEEKSEDTIIGKIGNGEYELKVRTTSGDFQLK